MKKTLLSSARWAAAALVVVLGFSAAQAQTVYSDNFQYANPNGVPPFTTSYTQVANNVINGMQPTGVFSITSNLAADLGGGQTQHPAIGANTHNFFDHTFNSANGLYMAVNGGAPSLLYGVTGIAVTPNTDYVFSVWMNSWTYAGAPTFGRVDVQVNGVSVGFADAPAIPDAYNEWGAAQNWTQRTIAFNSGNSSLIDLAIFNVNTEAGGNDYSIDDISITAVPEPSVIAMGSLGAIGFGAAAYSKIRARRRRKLAAKNQK